MKSLVLLGGGHAHVEVLKDLALKPEPGVKVTLVTPYPWFTYSAMVPGLLAGHYDADQCAIDLTALADSANAAVHFTQATLVNPEAREVICANSTVLAYDVLSINAGSSAFATKVRGLEEHAIFMRPLELAVKGWNRVLSRARDGGIGAVTLVGAGAAGVELALAMEHRFRHELGSAAPHVRILTDASEPVPEFPWGARVRFRRRLARRGIGLHVDSRVVEIGADFVRTQHGHHFVSDAVFWTAGAAAHDWIRDSGFATDDRGFLLTNEFLQSVSHGEVFAVGDCATRAASPLPKAGVFAVRAAPLLAANLRAAMAGAPLAPFVTRKAYLALVSAGERYAVGVWSGLSWEGGWTWRVKDHIDRKFMARYAAG